MSVTKRSWKQAGGKVKTAWEVKIKKRLPGMPEIVVRKNFARRSDAETYERETLSRIIAGTFTKQAKAPKPMPAPKPISEPKAVPLPTLSSFQETFMEASRLLEGNKHSTLTSKRQILRDHLVPAFGSMPLGSIGDTEIDDYKLTKLKAGYSAKFLNNQLSNLQNLLKLARRRKLITHVPDIEWVSDPIPAFDFLDSTKGEDVAFLNAVDPHWHPMMALALNTGLRLGELLALRWDCVDLEGGRLMVRRTVWRGVEGLPKGGRVREAGLNQASIQALQARLKLRNGPYVFHHEGQQMSAGKTRCPIYQASKKGVGRPFSWHVLRHSFASALAQRGVPLREIQEALGHSSLRMTERYSHLSPASKLHTVMALNTPISQYRPSNLSSALGPQN